MPANRIQYDEYGELSADVFPLFPRESQNVRFDKTISLHSVYSMTASYTSVDLLLNSFAAVKKNYFFTKKGYI